MQNAKFELVHLNGKELIYRHIDYDNLQTMILHFSRILIPHFQKINIDSSSAISGLRYHSTR